MGFLDIDTMQRTCSYSEESPHYNSHMVSHHRQFSSLLFKQLKLLYRGFKFTEFSRKYFSRVCPTASFRASPANNISHQFILQLMTRNLSPQFTLILTVCCANSVKFYSLTIVFCVLLYSITQIHFTGFIFFLQYFTCLSIIPPLLITDIF